MDTENATPQSLNDRPTPPYRVDGYPVVDYKYLNLTTGTLQAQKVS
jgi:hypothetical protein